MNEDNNLIMPLSSVFDEIPRAKNYWGTIDIKSYIPEQPWSRFIADRVLSFQPERVFEFGCNAGKNLETINRECATVMCCGVDINPTAVAHARSRGLRVAIADEQILELIPDHAYDVCFTVSVLDHLPNPGPVISELGRLSKRALLLLEPWLGGEGKVVRNYNVQRNEIIETTPYSYSWEYTRLAAELLVGWSCQVEPYPISTNLGRYYQLYTLIPPD